MPAACPGIWAPPPTVRTPLVPPDVLMAGCASDDIAYGAPAAGMGSTAPRAVSERLWGGLARLARRDKLGGRGVSWKGTLVLKALSPHYA